MNILVTGGSGFIGSHLVKALLDLGHSVDNWDIVRSRRLLIQNLDVFARKHDYDVCFHLAAKTSVPESWNDPTSYMYHNTYGSAVVFNYCRERNIPVIFSSTAAVYGEVTTDEPCGPHSQLDPANTYGLTKCFAETLLMRYAQDYLMRSITLRYSNVYGPGQKSGDEGGVIPIFLEKMSAVEEVTIYGDGEQTRDFLHVSDVVKANISAMDYILGNPTVIMDIFQIASGKSDSINLLFSLLNDKHYKQASKGYEDPRKGDVVNCSYDISLAKSRLGFESTITLEDGLLDLVERKKKEWQIKKRTKQ